MPNDNWKKEIQDLEEEEKHQNDNLKSGLLREMLRSAQTFDDSCEENQEADRSILLDSLQQKENNKVSASLAEKEKKWWRDREFAKAKLTEAWVKSDPALLSGHTNEELANKGLTRRTASASAASSLEASKLLHEFGARNTRGSDPGASASLRAALEEQLAHSAFGTTKRPLNVFEV